MNLFYFHKTSLGIFYKVYVFCILFFCSLMLTAQQLSNESYLNEIIKADEVLKDSPNDVNVLFVKAQALEQLGKIGDAALLYKQIIKIAPYLTEPYNNLAALQVRKGKHQNAILNLEKGIRQHHEFAVLYDNINLIYSELASQAYRKALNIQKSTEAPLTLVAFETLSPPDSIDIRLANVTLDMNEALLPNSTISAPILVAKSNASKAQTVDVNNNATDDTTDNDTHIDEASLIAKLEQARLAKLEEIRLAEIEKTKLAELEQKKLAELKKQRLAELEKTKEKSRLADLEKTKLANIAQIKLDELKKTKLNEQEKQQQDDELAALATVNDWVKAWSDQNIKRYLSYYAPNFKPQKNMTLTNWEKQRNDRLTRPKFINLKVSHVKNTISNNKATVTFKQFYQSDTFKNTTRKTLTLQKTNNEWKIIKEQT